MSNTKLQEIIDFFEREEGYDKDEVISDILSEIKELSSYASDEINLVWDDEELMTLDDFATDFYNKVIEKVCNVIKSFRQAERK